MQSDDALLQNDWIRQQPADQREALATAGRRKRLARGAWAHGEGDEDTGLLIVLTGGLRLYAQAPGGREALIALVGPGAAIGQSAVFGGGPRLVTAVAAQDTELFLLSDRALRQTAEAFPGLWRDLSSLLYAQLQLSVQGNAERAVLPPRALLALRLAQMSAARDRLGVSQTDLAELVGVSRKAVNGWLAEFAGAGLVRTGYGALQVLDRAGLARIAAEEGP